MRNMIRTIQIAGMLALGALAGCSTIMPPSPHAPFFQADSADAPLIDALAHEQFSRIESCSTRKSCPRDHYTQGLIALFQSRERAMATFQQVRTEAPTNSRLAPMSTAWIDLIQADGSRLRFLSGQSGGLPKVTEDAVWETLERELAGANERVRSLFNERAKRLGEVPDRLLLTAQDPPTEAKDKDLALIEREKDQVTQVTIQALQKRVRERERSLAERDQQLEVLASQLEAMRRIDQDARDRRQPKRPTAMTAPPSPSATPHQ